MSPHGDLPALDALHRDSHRKITTKEREP